MADGERYTYDVVLVERGGTERLHAHLNARGAAGWRLVTVVPAGADVLVIWEQTLRSAVTYSGMTPGACARPLQCNDVPAAAPFPTGLKPDAPWRVSLWTAPMAESDQDVRVQVAAERERLRDLGDTIFDEIRERRHAGDSLEALESSVVLYGHIVEAITALSRAQRPGEPEATADV